MCCLISLVWGKILFLQQLNSTEIFLLWVTLKARISKMSKPPAKVDYFPSDIDLKEGDVFLSPSHQPP